MDVLPYDPQSHIGCVLVDRSGLGGFEFFYDGHPWVFEPGQTELLANEAVAKFIMRSTSTRGWTKDGEYLNRLAVKNPSHTLKGQLGEDCGDTSLIELSPKWPYRVMGHEGWEAPERGSETEVKPVFIPSNERPEKQRQGIRQPLMPERG